MSSQLTTREIMAINGPRRIEGELAYDDGVSPTAAALLLCPHPFMGGTMENNVVRCLAGVLAERGCVALRFNYAPTPGEDLAVNLAAFWQTGHAPQDEALVGDARLARDWLIHQFDLPLVLIGYSFGCHVAATLLSEACGSCGTAAIVLIAPTVTQHDMPSLASAQTPKLVVHSNNDFATPQLATDAWYAGLAPPKDKRCFVNADHFYKGQEEELARVVASFLAPWLSATEGVR